MARQLGCGFHRGEARAITARSVLSSTGTAPSAQTKIKERIYATYPQRRAWRRNRCDGAAIRPRARAIADHSYRRAERPVRPVPRRWRPHRRGLRAPGAGGFRRVRQGPERGDHRRRPPEQARYRRHHCPAVVRPGRRGCDRRCAHFLGRACGQFDLPGEEQGAAEFRHRHLGPDRRAVQPEYDPLDLRHLHAGEIHCRQYGEAGRRHLVLHHRGLCLRPGVAARHDEDHRGGRRQGARQHRLSVPRHHGFLRAAGARAGIRGQGARAGERRRRYA